MNKQSNNYPSSSFFFFLQSTPFTINTKTILFISGKGTQTRITDLSTMLCVEIYKAISRQLD